MTWQMDAFVNQLRRLWPDTHETAGWRARNNRSTWVGGAPIGTMNHHTVSNPAEPPGPAVDRIVRGWAGLPGPIYGALVVTSGAVWLVAGGPANHAGMGVGRVRDRTRARQAPLGDAAQVYGRGSDTMSGNREYFSVSGQHRGTHPDWPARQLDGIVAVNAAFCLARGLPPETSIHHREWTARNIDMSWRGDLRGRVRALINNPNQPPAEDDNMAGFSPDQFVQFAASGFARGAGEELLPIGDGPVDNPTNMSLTAWCKQTNDRIWRIENALGAARSLSGDELGD